MTRPGHPEFFRASAHQNGATSLEQRASNVRYKMRAGRHGNGVLVGRGSAASFRTGRTDGSPWPTLHFACRTLLRQRQSWQRASNVRLQDARRSAQRRCSGGPWLGRIFPHWSHGWLAVAHPTFCVPNAIAPDPFFVRSPFCLPHLSRIRFRHVHSERKRRSPQVFECTSKRDAARL